MEIKICKKCNLSKILNIDNFNWRKDNNKWRETCRLCIKLIAKKRYKEKTEEIKTKAQQYREKHREEIRLHAMEYNHRDEVIKRMQQYRKDNRKALRKKEKEWRTKNPEKAKIIAYKKAKIQRLKLINRVKAHVSRQINFALHRSNSSKCGESCMKYLPYSIQDLKQYLESQFEPWMSWENWGVFKKTWNDQDPSTWTWQIDHIVPQSCLPYVSMTEENFKKCWALENLRPFSAKQNYLDGCNRTRHENKNTTIFGV